MQWIPTAQTASVTPRSQGATRATVAGGSARGHLAGARRWMRGRRVGSWLLAYGAAAWLMLQAADIVTESFETPERWMQLLILAACAAVPVVVACALLLPARLQRHARQAAAASAQVGESASLAVLPFQCATGEPELQWQCEALTEDLTMLLARIPGYFVAAHNSTLALRSEGLDYAALGAALDVRYLLEGSVRITPEGLRISAQLVDAATGEQRWSQRWDRGRDEFATLQDELCEAIALQLGVELTRVEVNVATRLPPASWGVWELYQQAKGKLQFSGWSTQTFEETEALLTRAIELDPDYAPARAYLALILALAHWACFHPDRARAYDSAMAHIDRAIALAPESSEVLGFAGCALSDLGHPERGIPIIERAIELNPANAQAHAALGSACVMSGDIERGTAQLEKALRISPADPGLAPWSSVLSIVRSAQERSEQGLAWAQKAVQADPRYFAGHAAMALAYAVSGDTGRARRSLDEARRLSADLSDEALAGLVGQCNWQRLVDAGAVTARAALPARGDLPCA